MGTSIRDLDFQKAKQASLHQRPAHEYCNTRGHHLLRSCRLLSSAGISVTQHLKSLSLLAPMTSTQMEPMTPLSGMGTIKVEDLKTAHPSSKSSWLAPAFGITNDKSKLRKKVNLFVLSRLQAGIGSCSGIDRKRTTIEVQQGCRFSGSLVTKKVPACSHCASTAFSNCQTKFSMSHGSQL